MQSKLRARSYNTFVESSLRTEHTVDHHLALVGAARPPRARAALQLHLPASALDAAERSLRDAGIHGDFVLVHPGSARTEKFWEAERWGEIVAFAASQNLPCVITGGNAALEQNHLAQIKAATRARFIDLSGQLDLLTLAALIEQARLLVTVDSAPMHLAAALQTPQVVLFGPTNPLHWRPRFSPAIILQAGEPAPRDAIFARSERRGHEPHLDCAGDRWYESAAGNAARRPRMSVPLEKKKKPSVWQTIRVGWRPYRRLYSYVGPYKFRFILGLAFGFAFGIISSCFPLVVGQVTNFVFQGAAPDPQGAHGAAGSS